jgi:hypothetical protein
LSKVVPEMKAGPQPCLKCNPLSGAVRVIETG